MLRQGDGPKGELSPQLGVDAVSVPALSGLPTLIICRKGRQPWYLLTGETLKVSVMPGT
ncbi:hypothetical protein H7F15_16105 [Pontibacter sp. Tf4]|uniref:hypothetical protein n=1 Tax=Pontibacter sp. Tf4 TaxID=2761620 RepID=UPI00162875C7|nr:hypothetical protein [Pontibacter sp. Tf4]MBB6612568.1 hypothetical protein [Pontibacter sp. Tf4]